jgi:hypothetical protein
MGRRTASSGRGEGRVRPSRSFSRRGRGLPRGGRSEAAWRAGRRGGGRLGRGKPRPPLRWREWEWREGFAWEDGRVAPERALSHPYRRIDGLAWYGSSTGAAAGRRVRDPDRRRLRNLPSDLPTDPVRRLSMVERCLSAASASARSRASRPWTACVKLARPRASNRRIPAAPAIPSRRAEVDRRSFERAAQPSRPRGPKAALHALFPARIGPCRTAGWHRRPWLGNFADD